ncbi:hypothetical protein AB0A71_15185 [Kitasatospora aureofaciens]|uniref:hypothetical protein n=1 Tax=Kitasatospora aureofaciens TaxID=1894 RepID=UPI0033F46DA6
MAKRILALVDKDPEHAQPFRLSLPGGHRVRRTPSWHDGDGAPTVRHGSAPGSLAPYSAAVVLLDPRD